MKHKDSTDGRWWYPCFVVNRYLIDASIVVASFEMGRSYDDPNKNLKKKNEEKLEE